MLHLRLNNRIAPPYRHPRFVLFVFPERSVGPGSFCRARSEAEDSAQNEDFVLSFLEHYSFYSFSVLIKNESPIPSSIR